MLYRPLPNSLRALLLGIGAGSMLLAGCGLDEDSPELGTGAAAIGFDWGSDCSAGSGEFTDSIPYRSTTTIGDIPIGKRNVAILLDSDVDVDVQLLEKATGKQIIAWPSGLLSGAGRACTEYKGVEYCYSGYNGIDGRLGKESIEVNGDTNTELVMRAYGYVAGDARVTYEWQPVPTCNETGDGAFSAYLPQNDVQLIGDIPVGKVNVLISLSAAQDLDIQLFDGERALVRWPDGDLSGAGEQSLDYQGMHLTWSGYNGDGTGLGHEFIRIDGRVTSTLTMKAFAYQAGTAQVTYEWGIGAGAACGGRTYPVNPPCGEALQCKDTVSGGMTFDAPGECHTESWCFSAEMAAENCAGLPHIAVPGSWGCEEFVCTYVASGGGSDDPTPIAIELPRHELTNPQLYLCSAERPCSTTPVLGRACPEGNPDCDPAASATISWHVVDALDSTSYAFSDFRLSRFSGEQTLHYESGPGSGSQWSSYLLARNASSIELRLDSPIQLTFYDVTLSPGQSLDLSYDGSGFSSAAGNSYFYQYSAYDPEIDHLALHRDVDDVVSSLVELTGRNHVLYNLYMMPTDIAATLGGEGNFSFGDGTITVNYGNPAWIAAMGGAQGIIITEVAHEYTHELFRQIRAQFTGYTCLNEGLADATGNHLGYIADANFGSPLSGPAFATGCTELTKIHDKGNCVLYHAKEQGLFAASFFHGLFNPQQTLAFDSCDLSSSTTGNAYLVYFTEAAGLSREAAVIAALDAAGLTHAGSYAAARAALGL